MSHCLILQQYNDFYIGADSAGSIKINDSFYRTSNNMQKIFKLGTDIYFCSGIDKYVNICNEWINERFTDKINVIYLRNFLKNTFIARNQHSKELVCFDIEILLCRVEDGISKVYHFAQYNNFDIVIYEGRENQINIICGGCKTSDGFNIAKASITCGNVKQIYDTVFQHLSDERIGGNLSVYHGDTLYCMSQIDDYQINTHLVLAEAVVSGYVNGSVIEGGSLDIGVSGGHFKVDENGKVTITGPEDEPLYADTATVNEIAQAKQYTTQLVYSNSTIFSKSTDSCTITCKVLSWNDDITEQVKNAGATFSWVRSSNDSVADAEWSNLNANQTSNEITITSLDVNKNAQFYCIVDFDDDKLILE